LLARSSGRSDPSGGGLVGILHLPQDGASYAFNTLLANVRFNAQMPRRNSAKTNRGHESRETLPTFAQDRLTPVMAGDRLRRLCNAATVTVHLASLASAHPVTSDCITDAAL
jgi:hypothetical protein